MAPRRFAHALADIETAIDDITAILQNKTIEDFGRDRMLRLAAERTLEIVSEATRHLPSDFLEMHAHIDWAAIKAAGNVLRHEYFRVSEAVVWRTVKQDLPLLREVVSSASRETDDVA